MPTILLKVHSYGTHKPSWLYIGYATRVPQKYVHVFDTSTITACAIRELRALLLFDVHKMIVTVKQL